MRCVVWTAFALFAVCVLAPIMSDKAIRGATPGGTVFDMLSLSIASAQPTGASTTKPSDWAKWERYMDSGQRALEQGREVAAEQWFLDAAREAERLDPKSEQLVRSLTSLVGLYRKQGRPEADSLTQRLATLSRQAASQPRGPDVLVALERYAILLKENGRERDAAIVERRAQTLREPSARASQGNLLLFSPVAELRNYAGLLHQLGRHAEARTIELLAAAEARQAISRYATLRKGLAAESAQPALTFEWQVLGGLEALRGRLYPEAEALFRDAVRTAETFTSSPNVQLANSLSLLAFSYRAQGKIDEFNAVVQRAMPILERAAGTSSAQGWRSFVFLAMAHLRFEFEPMTALAHFQASLPILEKDLVRDHPVIGLHLAGLAAAHLALSHRSEATPYLDRALAIASQQYLPEHVPLAIALMKVVDVYAAQSDFPRAYALAQRVVLILGKMLDANHPDVIAATELYRWIGEQLKQPKAVASLTAFTTVPVQIEGNATLVRGTVNRTQGVLLLLDTGASVTTLRPIVLARLGAAIPADAPRRRMTAANGMVTNVPLVTVALQVGDAKIEHLLVAVDDVFPGSPDLDGLLGADFLQQFRMTLDKVAHKLTLEPLQR